jgi:hypothetical protein
MSDITAMVLMVIVTLLAQAMIWGTYVRRRLLERGCWRERTRDGI